MFEIDVDFHQFQISSGDEIDEPTASGTVCLVSSLTRTRLWVRSGAATGPVSVETQALHSAPADIDETWEDVAEVSVEVLDPPLEVGGWVTRAPETARLDSAGPGTYRVRIHARGRDNDDDGSVPRPVEDYLVQAWPAPSAPPLTLRATSKVAHGELR